ncbi:hypothetical protein HL653_00115 [Sphingomonas sp. AP4-R1]|uniref:hypothetical protein n=1 Tax=Sphingomonas sp. AP4-R1 TaxID=2735134 RepID=UPI0014939571|nr:hypothetical protein [Sphingomonas sp. AP4-R1]QJU56396.1 hypothetical protein HL653_00115 [Sphingomonas sp. AP4-R1]
MHDLSVLARSGLAALVALSGGAIASAQAPAQSPAVIVTAPVSRADAKALALGKVSAAFFLGLQELPAFTPEEMAARHQGATGDPEALAADQALNDWKLCALESITHWADLKPGRGEIVDGAMGRCVDVEHAYRGHLLKITQDGRLLFDLSFARQMAKSLEDAWRPRILAAALDHDLEAVHAEKEKPVGTRRRSGSEPRAETSAETTPKN